MRKLSVPQEDNENFYCPGKKSLYWSLVHVRMHPLLKQDKYFSDGGKNIFLGYKNDVHQESKQKTLCFTNHLWSGFLPSLRLPRLVQQEVPWLYITSSVVHCSDSSCPLTPLNFSQAAVAVSGCSTSTATCSAAPKAADFRTEDFLPPWKLEKFWQLQETFLNCKCGFEWNRHMWPFTYLFVLRPLI